MQTTRTYNKEKQTAFLKTCKAIYSCKKVSELKGACKLKALYYKKYGFSQYIENQYDRANRDLIIADFLKTFKN